MESTIELTPGIKKNIQILALNILIASYKEVLEDKELNLDQDSREFLLTMIEVAQDMITELEPPINQVTPRPVWKK